MSEPWGVEVYCPCGTDLFYRLYVREDLRRCRSCGRTFRMALDPESGACDVEMDPRSVGGGLLADDGVRVLSIICWRSKYGGSSLVLEEASSSSKMIPSERAVGPLIPERFDDQKPESPSDGALAEVASADARGER